MARADTFRSQGRGNRLCAWQEQPQVFGYEPRPDTHTALVWAIIHHSRRSHFAWLRCLHCIAFLFARTLHLPARTLPLFLCLPVCLCESCVVGHRVPARACGACAGPSCVNALHLFACAFPVPQLTNSIHKAKKKGHRAHEQIMHAYGPKSTPIAQELVGDINAKHACGPRSAPIAQGLVYNINATHAFGLRELKRTYGFLSTPIAQGLVTIINAKDQKC